MGCCFELNHLVYPTNLSCVVALFVVDDDCDKLKQHWKIRSVGLALAKICPRKVVAEKRERLHLALDQLSGGSIMRVISQNSHKNGI